MNVIFLDFFGVLESFHFDSLADVEKRVKILAYICHKYKSKVVISAQERVAIDIDSMTSKKDYIDDVLVLLKKYNIECIGKTPCVGRRIDDLYAFDNWKEDEVRLYLYNHPEVEHYCVIGIDALAPNRSDLNKIKDHLVETFYSSYPLSIDNEGLCGKHVKEVGEVLNKRNNIRVLALRKKDYEN